MQERQVISTAAYLKQKKPCMLTFRDKPAKIYKEEYIKKTMTS